MTARTRSAIRSAFHRPARTGLWTTCDRLPPRPYRLFLILSPSLWQLTTRPPRIRSDSQLPVETGVLICVRAGRTESGRQDLQVTGL